MNIMPSATTGEARDCSPSNLCIQAPPSCLLLAALICFRVEKRLLSQPPATAGQPLPAACLGSGPTAPAAITGPAASIGIAMTLESSAVTPHLDWLDMFLPLVF